MYGFDFAEQCGTEHLAVERRSSLLFGVKVPPGPDAISTASLIYLASEVKLVLSRCEDADLLSCSRGLFCSFKVAEPSRPFFWRHLLQVQSLNKNRQSAIIAEQCKDLSHQAENRGESSIE